MNCTHCYCLTETALTVYNTKPHMKCCNCGNKQLTNNVFTKYFTSSGTSSEIACLHDSCPKCNGTGKRIDGLGNCVHAISCPCPKHAILC